MILIYKKTDIDTGAEYIDINDIPYVDPCCGKESLVRINTFLDLLAAELNYYLTNTSTAFGNPDLALIQGKVTGFCIAKGWEQYEKNGWIYFRRGNRTIIKVQRPAIPAWEKEARREITEMLREL